MCLGGIHVESELVLASEEEDFWVGNLGVSEEDLITAKVRLWLGSRDEDFKLGVRNFLVFKGDLFEAFA